MTKLCVFAASNSKKSINQELALYAASRIEGAEVDLLDLNDFEMPIFSLEREASGIPDLAKSFSDRLVKADGLVIGLAEHNGSYSVAFKNILDWVSRMESKGWAGKPTFLMATSPGARGGQGVLNIAVASFPHFGMNVTSSFSLPSFSKNFEKSGIADEALSFALDQQITLFKTEL